MKDSFVHNLNPSCCHLSPLFSPYVPATRQSHRPSSFLLLSHSLQPHTTKGTHLTPLLRGWNWSGCSLARSRRVIIKKWGNCLPSARESIPGQGHTEKSANTAQELITGLWRNESLGILLPVFTRGQYYGLAEERRGCVLSAAGIGMKPGRGLSLLPSDLSRPPYLCTFLPSPHHCC